MNKLTPGNNLLWSTMRWILPEHRDALNQWDKEKKEFTLPDYDEQHWENVNRKLQCALHAKETIKVTYADRYGPKQYIGSIRKMDSTGQWIEFENQEDRKMLPLFKIMDIENV